MRSLSTVFLLLIPLLVLSQTIESQQENLTFGSSDVAHSENQLEGFDLKKFKQGTFLYDDWEKGKILLGNSTVQKHQLLNFNVVDNYFVAFDTEKKKYVKITFNDPVKEIALGSSKFVFVQKASDNQMETFELITGTDKTEIKLLKQYRTELTSGILKQTEFYHHKETFFLQQKGQQAIEVEPKTKFILKLLGDSADEMKLFIKQEKLKMNKEADLKKLIEYYNLINADPFR